MEMLPLNDEAATIDCMQKQILFHTVIATPDSADFIGRLTATFGRVFPYSLQSA
jgi:hypothetical protein